MEPALEPAQTDALVGAGAGSEGEAGAAGGAGGEDEGGVFVLDPSDVNGDCARLVCLAPGCGRVFKSKPNLVVHQRGHGPQALSALAQLPAAGAPPLARNGKVHCFVDGCPYGPGGKTLSSKKSAVQHFQQRHAEKVHFCSRPGCSASFAKAHQLNRHVQNAHGSFKCKCEVSFGSRHALNKHCKHFGANAPDAHAPVDGSGEVGAAGGTGGAADEEDDDAALMAHAAPIPPGANAIL